jgi:DNA-3-methyladenine glycosylase I
MLSLEGAQAGLSWLTILKKRAGYRKAFARFHPRAVAAFDRKKVRDLIRDPGIVRNRRKVESVVTNASAALRVAREHGSLAAYLWSFAPGTPRRSGSERPTETESSRAMSGDLRRRGFRFVGPTTCYSLMQAVGMVNDHEASCFRRREVERPAAPGSRRAIRAGRARG